jgi:hypothetical protein
MRSGRIRLRDTRTSAYGQRVREDTRRVWPPQLVEVFDDGLWRRAQLEAWKHGSDGLQASIRYCADPGWGLTGLSWVDRTRVRDRHAPAAT